MMPLSFLVALDDTDCQMFHIDCLLMTASIDLICLVMAPCEGLISNDLLSSLDALDDTDYQLFPVDYFMMAPCEDLISDGVPLLFGYSRSHWPCWLCALSLMF